MEINPVFINALCLIIWVNSCITFPHLITEHSVVNETSMEQFLLSSQAITEQYKTSWEMMIPFCITLIVYVSRSSILTVTPEVSLLVFDDCFNK